MKHRKKVMSQAAFHLFLFCLGWFLFGWPILTISSGQSAVSFIYYLFICWAIILCLLFLISRSLRDDDKGGEP